MSTTYIKIMSKEDKADNNCSKGFQLIPVDNDRYLIETGIAGKSDSIICFEQSEQNKPYICVIDRFDKIILEIYFPEGNVYIVNDSGQTVSAFG